VIREITLPEITTEQRVEIAIRVALTCYDDPTFVGWAEKWLSGEDRSIGSAHAALYAALYADDAAVAAVYDAATTYAAADAAAAAAVAAVYAAAKAGPIDLLPIIERVMGSKEAQA
jgi:hypothetical protein